jgi:predicted nucleic acid-binding protein
MNGDSHRFTLDSNILIYSVDTVAGERHRLALEIVDRAGDRDCCLTLQAISEFFTVVTRKGIMPRADAAALAMAWLEIFSSTTASISAVRAALSAAVTGRASYWDALLLATAGEAGCTTVLSEDMAEGTQLLGVTISDPFAGAGIAPLARQLLGMT